MRTYRISSLASALLRMWRGWSVLVPVIVLNALLQGLLVWPPFTNDSGAYSVFSAIVSGLVFLAAYALVAAVALRVADGRVGWATAIGVIRPNAARYLVWALIWSVVVVVGLALHTIPGLVVMALTPFLLLAALDGASSPFSRNFHTMGRRFWRWLVTVVIIGIGVLIGTVIAGFTVFFWRGGIGAALVWLVGGLLFAWITVTWGLIYRSAWAESVVAPKVAADPDLESTP